MSDQDDQGTDISELLAAAREESPVLYFEGESSGARESPDRRGDDVSEACLGPEVEPSRDSAGSPQESSGFGDRFLSQRVASNLGRNARAVLKL